MPFLQRLEQHSVLPWQVSPRTLHVAVDPGGGWHVPPEQLPLQQLLLAEHATPELRHC
jgi:hypothetical protein